VGFASLDRPALLMGEGYAAVQRKGLGEERPVAAIGGLRLRLVRPAGYAGWVKPLKIFRETPMSWGPSRGWLGNPVTPVLGISIPSRSTPRLSTHSTVWG